jgi:hypothetical protein
MISNVVNPWLSLDVTKSLLQNPAKLCRPYAHVRNKMIVNVPTPESYEIKRFKLPEQVEPFWNGVWLCDVNGYRFFFFFPKTEWKVVLAIGVF